MSAKRRYPLDYRLEEVNYLMRRWRTGASVSIVGVGSSGKTNLLQHVLEPATRQHFLTHEAAAIVPIVVDANLLGPVPTQTPFDAHSLQCWSLYELMLHQLYLGLYPFSTLSAEAVEQILRAYRALHDGRDPNLAYMALRYFELAIDTVVRSGIRIVFVFDEFEETLRRIPGEAFRALRALRDEHKRSISYTVLARAPLPVLITQFGLSIAEIEPFIELFSDDVLFLGPFSDRDARRFLNEWNARYGNLLSPEWLSSIHQLTGGHAGLMRAAFHYLRDLSAQVTGAVTIDVNKILTSPALLLEVETIWKGLSPIEQAVLKAVVRTVSYNITEETEIAVNLLIRRHLLIVDRQTNTLSIQPPIFAQFLRSREV